MKFLLPLFGLAVLLSACSGGGTAKQVGPQNIALAGPEKQSVTLTVEVADEPSEYAKGLMGREALAMGEGMLFIYPVADVLTCWMKDTLIPLDIIFFNTVGEVVSMSSMVPCEETLEDEECPRYSSTVPAMYALEVPAGFIDTYGVNLGWKLGLKGE